MSPRRKWLLYIDTHATRNTLMLELLIQQASVTGQALIRPLDVYNKLVHQISIHSDQWFVDRPES